jgi:hypothetical protein
MKRFLVLAVLTLTAVSALAQTPESAKHAKVRRLLELTGEVQLAPQMLDGMIESFKAGAPDAPDEFWTGFRAKIKVEDLVDLLVPIYEKYLTEADMDGLIAFYLSPVGKRFVEKKQAIMADSMKAGQAWGARLAEEVVEDLQKLKKQ